MHFARSGTLTTCLRSIFNVAIKKTVTFQLPIVYVYVLVDERESA